MLPASLYTGTTTETATAEAALDLGKDAIVIQSVLCLAQAPRDRMIAATNLDQR